MASGGRTEIGAAASDAINSQIPAQRTDVHTSRPADCVEDRQRTGRLLDEQAARARRIELRRAHDHGDGGRTDRRSEHGDLVGSHVFAATRRHRSRSTRTARDHGHIATGGDGL